MKEIQKEARAILAQGTFTIEAILKAAEFIKEKENETQNRKQ